MKQEDLNFWHIPLGMILAIVVIIMMMCSCKSIEYVPVIEKEVHHDSIYFNQVVRDSVYSHDSIYIKDKGDTVRIEHWHTKYVARIDTVVKYQAVRDSIPVPYPVKEYVEKKLSKPQMALMLIGLLSLMAAIVGLTIWIKKKLWL